MENNPSYTYAPRGSSWAVLKMTYFPGYSTGDVVAYFPSKEMAREKAKMLCQLNALNIALVTP